jgi:signal transduction histidine kinase/ligand-binding sensor domain-containing protein
MEPIGRRVRVLAAVLGVLVLLAGGARGQSSWVDRGCQFRRWSVEDGLPQVTVTALAQTPDGYLWIATFGGLCRFDGVSFDTFDFLNSPLPSNRVTGLFAGRDGVLWIGTEEGWLARYRAGRFETIGQLDSGVLHRFVQTPDGRLFVSSYRHWYQADTGGGPTLVETPWPTEGSPQSSPLDSAGRAWISGGSVVVRDGRGRETPVESDTPWGAPVSVSTDADGTLAVASDMGVFLGRWDTEPARVRRVDERPAHRVLVSDLGVLAARGRTISRLSSPDAQRAAPAWSDHEVGSRVDNWLIDAEGTVWLGTDDGGLLALRDSGFRLFGLPGRPSGQCAVALYPGRVLLGLHGGLYTADEGRPESTAPFEIGGELARGDSMPRVLMRARNDDLWIGIGPRVLRLSPDLAVLGEYTLGDAGVYTILEDEDGSIWAAGGDGIGRLGPGAGRFEMLAQSEELTRDGPVRALCRCPDGRLLIGAAGGLFALDPQGVRRLECVDAGPVLNVRALFRDPGGGVWVGTYGCGLLRLEGAELRRLTEDDGLLDNCVSNFQLDRRARLWMNTNAGAFCASLESLNRAVEGEGGLADVAIVKSGECNHHGGWISEEGVIWFPTVDGVVAIDTTRIRSNTVKPGVTIKAVESDGSWFDGVERIELAPQHNNLTFSYAGLSFVDPGLVRFRYRLDGYDTGWIDAGQARTATYRRLAPGRYTFRVMASNDHGVWSDTEASVRVLMRPHFYETGLFLFSAAGALMGLVYALHAHRLSVIRAHNRELRHQIDERERVEREKEEVECELRRAHKLEAIGTLAGGIAHDFNNLLFAIETGATHLRRNAGVNGSAGKALSIIDRSVDQARAIIQSLRTFSEHHEVAWERLDLADCVEECRPTLESLLSPSHELVMELDRAGPPETLGNGAQIQQVVMNLVVNARDAMARGGKIVVRVGVSEVDVDYIDVRVTDQGTGIDEATKARMFDPFFSTKPLGEGTGLGLAIVYGVLKDHAGRIRLDSTPGQGTTVTVAFKRAVA